jgi:hypothetical protein
MAFFAKPRGARPLRGPRGFPPLWKCGRLPYEFPKLLEAILPVLLLIAETLRIEHQFPFGRHPPPLLAPKPSFDIGRHARTAGDVPAQDRLGGHLIDILTTRTAGADETPSELAFGDADLVIDYQHGYSRGMFPLRPLTDFIGHSNSLAIITRRLYLHTVFT